MNSMDEGGMICVQAFSRLETIFMRTREAIGNFIALLQPLVDNAQDEHTRLYYHHIIEEEEQRLGRLQELLPYLQSLAADSKAKQVSDRELSSLLSAINLERFGLHNFREHVELSLYEFSEPQTREWLSRLREETLNDYIAVKEMMAELSQRFTDHPGFDMTDHDEGQEIHQIDHAKASAGKSEPHTFFPAKKGLTVGSLRQQFS
jgi:hypothetical protein